MLAMPGEALARIPAVHSSLVCCASGTNNLTDIAEASLLVHRSDMPGAASAAYKQSHAHSALMNQADGEEAAFF